MKANELKKMIKEAVKEAIQDELKEILLEAIKTPKQVVNETKLATPTTNTTTPINPTPSLSLSDKRQSYLDIIGETGLNIKSGDAQGFGNKAFNPQGVGDTTSPNGKLPDGEVNMNQIMNLMR